ncbi:MAG: hypothetical protein A3H17_00520 [Candidatus Levybacteria bacterium RIFCSPLOWO2_12_FULL_37_14]|nr:MAG: hypothetical protein US55_C0009G0007 [Candidatus Levybacteria bacterium GW2011_GWC2_37_7]KKQ42499.1 MAG: hypothetical protein US59_C0008G0018 [Candidatus Levybacteria bacterium GW2011_GWB1_37_8]OGH50178.1 MAG: hypothetical protein A3H17_00520 [Candidatus Levybacteria bacterium RIFCSPLOWO2_12_FULL_37_14]
MDTIPCPNCGKQIQVTQALKHQLEEKIRINEQAKHKVELEKIKVQTAALTEKRLKDVSQKELEKSENEKKLLEKKLEKEKAGKDQFERKIKEDALKNAEEEQRLKFKEKDLQLEEIRKVNEDLKRKIEQGSQQRQGEVLELDLEEKLHAQFPNDEFLPIPKGIEGADIWQKILYQGKIVGSILWETKRTKAWSSAWINKLKEDLVKTNASEAILISQVLPNDSNSFDRKNGIWIAKYEHAISLGRFVRFLLTNVAIVKSSTSHTEEEWGKIRDYMMGDAFKHRMQAHFEVIKSLKDNLDAEKRTSMLRWKREESIINKIDSNTTNFYGELKAIVPQLPQIDGAETPIDNST